MSRVASNPVVLPSGVEVKFNGQDVEVKGAKGTLQHSIHPSVEVTQDDDKLRFAPRNNAKKSRALAGTTRALLNNMVVGVTNGFERKLEINGVGYRAQAQGDSVNLTLGFSHPVEYKLPEGVTAESPKPTELVLKGIDKQRVGQAAADIRAFRPPEPYKGKGVRYADETVRRKEAKKK
jgi:large subunit ribosomal protein L6